MHELAARLSAGELMCVFPEGTTSNGLGLLPFHANMFQAAVSAGVPVQPVCIMYEHAQGGQSTAPAYIDDLSLSDSLDMLLRGGPLTAHVYVGAPLAPDADRRVLAARAQDVVAGALRDMQAGKAVAGTVAQEGNVVAAGSSKDAAATAETLIEPVDQPRRSA
jgi:1-acyl-sn-glycerol-3-phosphate acyltransferase